MSQTSTAVLSDPSTTFTVTRHEWLSRLVMSSQFSRETRSKANSDRDTLCPGFTWKSSKNRFCEESGWRFTFVKRCLFATPHAGAERFPGCFHLQPKSMPKNRFRFLRLPFSCALKTWSVLTHTCFSFVLTEGTHAVVLNLRQSACCACWKISPKKNRGQNCFLHRICCCSLWLLQAAKKNYGRPEGEVWLLLPRLDKDSSVYVPEWTSGTEAQPFLAPIGLWRCNPCFHGLPMYHLHDRPVVELDALQCKQLLSKPKIVSPLNP